MKELTCVQSDRKDVEVKLFSDRPGRLITGKTYSCYPEDKREARDVKMVGTKMFHNFGRSADQKVPGKANETFTPEIIKSNSERKKEEENEQRESRF